MRKVDKVEPFGNGPSNTKNKEQWQISSIKVSVYGDKLNLLVLDQAIPKIKNEKGRRVEPFGNGKSNFLLSKEKEI